MKYCKALGGVQTTYYIISSVSQWIKSFPTTIFSKKQKVICTAGKFNIFNVQFGVGSLVLKSILILSSSRMGEQRKIIFLKTFRITEIWMYAGPWRFQSLWTIWTSIEQENKNEEMGLIIIIILKLLNSKWLNVFQMFSINSIIQIY